MFLVKEFQYVRYKLKPFVFLLIFIDWYSKLHVAGQQKILLALGQILTYDFLPMIFLEFLKFCKDQRPDKNELYLFFAEIEFV